MPEKGIEVPRSYVECFRVIETGVQQQYKFTKANASVCGAWDFNIEDDFFAYSDCIMMLDLRSPLLRFSMPLETRRRLNA